MLQKCIVAELNPLPTQASSAKFCTGFGSRHRHRLSRTSESFRRGESSGPFTTTEHMNLSECLCCADRGLCKRGALSYRLARTLLQVTLLIGDTHPIHHAATPHSPQAQR